MNNCYFKMRLGLMIVVAVCTIAVLSDSVLARTQLKNICRVKGQEENVLRGLGLVVGLNGTGEANDGPTMRAIARAMEIMGNPLAGGQQGSLEELKKIKNVSLVMVTATIPATGARRGDKLNAYVSALNGKSLVGGRLAFASLQGPNTSDKRVYALCQGQIVVDNPDQPMVGVVQGGCQMEADIFTPFFTADGYLTLILDSNHANFYTAALIAETINGQFSESLNYSDDAESAQEPLCQARDASNIVVRIPKKYRNDPVTFASDILDIRLYEHEPEARVVVNPRAGSIVISGDIEIGDVVVSHKNIVVDVETVPFDRFTAIDVDETNDPKLKQLVDQLNLLKVPTLDMIEIIRGIDRNGKLHGRLIIE